MHHGKVQFQSKNCHETHGRHCNFTAWTLDLSWIGIKDATTGQNPHSVFKIQVLAKAWFLNSLLFFSLPKLISPFLPPLCHFTPPLFLHSHLF